jgi:tagaturonate epimerase
MEVLKVNINDAIQDLKALDIDVEGNKVMLYEQSYMELEGTQVQMIKIEGKKYIVAAGSGNLYDELKGIGIKEYKMCPLTHENRLVLNKYFEYTKPRAFGRAGATIGLGDRLGLASPGHIKAVRDKNIKPILAQQSIRELSLTNRTYEDVLDAVCFAVFQEGYKGGFGADGDHLKLEEDIKMALDLGFTMITLDCSEKIDNTIEGALQSQIENKYSLLPEEERKYYENKYLDKNFSLKESTFSFDKVKVIKNVLIYGEAIKFMKLIYEKYVKTAGRAIDFEISIDETMTPTAPESHFFIAEELYSNGIEVNSMAPRFCGEFQKGIDYIGDIDQFERELKIHVEIADNFGYKLSIHSGSDKFSVFPIIGKYTKGRFHAKTAGTNWLEAVRVVSKINPSLYRRMHKYALEHFEEAKKYYHVTTDISAIKDIDKVSDSELVSYMDDNNARQLIHITYGLLLQAKDSNGKYLFKDEFYKILNENEDKYDQALMKHIRKHIELLGI